MNCKIFYYDIETTGVNFWQHGIHQLSGAIEINGEIKERFNFKVQPNTNAKIVAEALAVANVTQEMVMSYEPMQEVYKKVLAMLKKYVHKFNSKDKFFLCGFRNTSFDDLFLKAWFVQNNDQYFFSWFWGNSLDVSVLATQHLLAKRVGMENFKLHTVAKQLGIEVDESRLHDAEYDIDLTIAIYKSLCSLK